MSTSTIYKVAFFGNSGVGKSNFLSLISDNSYMNDMEVKFQFVKRKILGIDYTIHTTELGGIMKTYDQQTWKNKISLLGQVDLVIIFFDVSNRQSFLDVGRFWLPRIRQSVKTKKIVLLANKIDKQMIQTMYNMTDFSILNKSKLFYSSSKLNCKQIFDKIILYHENQITQQKIISDRPKRENGFFSKIFSGKNDSEDLKQKKQELKKILEDRIYELKKSFDEKQKQFQQNARQMETKYSQRVNKIGLSISSSWVSKGQSLKDNLQALNNQIIKIKKGWSQSSLQQLNQIQELREQLQRAKKDSNQKSKLKEELQQQKLTRKKIEGLILESKNSQNTLRESFDNQRLELHKRISDLDEQKRLLQKKAMEYMNQNALLRQSQQINRTIMQIQKLQPQYTNIFYAGSFRAIQKPALQELCNNITKMQGREISHFNLVYRFDLCCNNSFHNFIDNRPNLFYLIGVEDVRLIVYSSQRFMKNKPSKGLVMLLKNSKELKNFHLNEGVSICKYDPLVLSFSKGQIQVKFMKESCSLLLRNKKESVFVEAININELLQLPENENGSYKINFLEIYQIQF